MWRFQNAASGGQGPPIVPDAVEQDFWQFLAAWISKTGDIGSESDQGLPDSNRSEGHRLESERTQSSDFNNQPRPWSTPVPPLPELYRRQLTSSLAEGLENISAAAEQLPVSLLQKSPTNYLQAGGMDSPADNFAPVSAATEGKVQHQQQCRHTHREQVQMMESQPVSALDDMPKASQQQQLGAQKPADCSSIAQERMDSQAASDLDMLRQKFGDLEASNTAGGRGLIITVHGKSEAISLEKLSTMDLPEFSRLWTAYIVELASLLLQLADNPGNHALTQRLEGVTVESSQLMGIVKPLNLKVYNGVLEGRLDEGLTDPKHILDAKWYSDFPKVLALSDSQVRDLLHVRKLYLTKRGRLAMQRDALVDELHHSQPEKLVSGDTSLNKSESAAKLCKNAAEDYLTYVKIACVGRRGILSTEQWATLCIQSYPYFCNLELILEGLAQRHGDPSMSEMLLSARHNALDDEWAALDKYVGKITAKYYPDYVPIYMLPESQSSEEGATVSSLAQIHQLML